MRCGGAGGIQTDVQGRAGGKSEVALRMDVSSLGSKHRMMPGKLSQSISDTHRSAVFFPVCLHCCDCRPQMHKINKAGGSICVTKRSQQLSVCVCAPAGRKLENSIEDGMPIAHWG